MVTEGFALPAKYIIHAVGPIWKGGSSGEAELLYGAYKSSLEVAKKKVCGSIGFPLISAGIYGYPIPEAWQIAGKACNDFRTENITYKIEIIFAVLEDAIMRIGQKELQEFS